jgi:hypothetical protein
MLLAIDANVKPALRFSRTGNLRQKSASYFGSKAGLFVVELSVTPALARTTGS